MIRIRIDGNADPNTVYKYRHYTVYKHSILSFSRGASLCELSLIKFPCMGKSPIV
jgi:hypothetical protein